MDTQNHISTREAVLCDIHRYCSARGISTSTFGRLSVNDGKLVKRLESGGRMTTDTMERILSFIERNPAPEAA